MIKKLIFTALLPFTFVLEGAFVMKKGQPLQKVETTVQEETTSTNTQTFNPSSLSQYNYSPRALPPKNEWYDVTQKENILCNGSHDDTAGFQALIEDTSVTNWYIAPNKVCKFFNIDVKSHLKTVFGGGKIIVKGNTMPYDGGGSHTGVFLMESDINGFLIDNIDFEVDKEGWGTINLWPNNGIIHLGGIYNNKNIEIRNCNVDLTRYPMNFIKGYVNQKNGNKLSNVVIVNNTIKGFKQFAIEILGGSANRTFTKRPAESIKILRNKFIGHSNSSLRRCISIPFLFFGKGLDGLKNGKEAYISENWFIDVEWGMETTGSSGIYVNNNLFTGKSMQAWHDVPERYITGNGTYRNYYFHNVIMPNPTAILRKGYNGSHLEVGAGSEIYENYIGTAILINKHNEVLESTVKGLNVHDNIFSVEEANGIKIGKAVTFKNYPAHLSTFRNNKFYMSPTGTGLFNKTSSSFNNNILLDTKPQVPSNWGLTGSKLKIGTQE